MDLERDSPYQYLGDIYICTDTANSIAPDHNHSFEQELILYVIHATLHLLGYTDIEPDERAIMKKKEKYYHQEIFKELAS